MNNIQELKEKIKGLKVLFTDDEEQIRKGTGKLLNKFFDTVIICEDGQQGLDSFKKEKDFDIVIADIQMPKMDGIEMVEKIKEINPDIFTIFITAGRGDSIVDENLYDLYIQKPISYEDMKLIFEKASTLR